MFCSRCRLFESFAPYRILGALHHYHDVPVLFVRVKEMPDDERSQLEREGIRVQPLAAFTGAEEIAENFYLYRLELSTPEPVAQGTNLPALQSANKGTANVE